MIPVGFVFEDDEGGAGYGDSWHGGGDTHGGDGSGDGSFIDSARDDLPGDGFGCGYPWGCGNYAAGLEGTGAGFLDSQEDEGDGEGTGGGTPSTAVHRRRFALTP